MGVLQPLYFTAGKYTADLDRTMLAALIDPESNKSRAGGVLPPVSSMKVSIASATATVATGMCVVADTATAGPDSYGLYLAGVDTGSASLNFSTLSLASGSYIIYAEVNESAFRVTNKVLTSNSATLTYSETAQKFVVGQTIYVTGVDDTFDGVYVVTGVGGSGTAWTVTYARTASNVSTAAVTAVAIYGGAEYVITDADISSNTATIITSTGIGAAVQDLVTIKGVGTSFDGTYQIATISSTTFTYKKITANASNALAAGGLASSVARVSGPFNIKAASGSTVPGSITAIPLATVSWNGTALSSLVDKRQFVSATGGVHHWDSSSTGATKGNVTTAPGKLLFDAKSTTAQTLEIYDGVSASWNTLYKTNDWSHVLDATLASSVLAAPANHNHDTTYALDITTGAETASATNVTISSTNSASPTTITSQAITLAAQESVLIIASCSFTLSGTTANNYTNLGIVVDGGGIANIQYVGNVAGNLSASVMSLNTLSAGSHTLTLAAYKDSSALTSVASQYTLIVVPIKALT